MAKDYPTKEQADLIKRNHLNPFNWKVAFENKSTLEIVIARYKITRISEEYYIKIQLRRKNNLSDIRSTIFKSMVECMFVFPFLYVIILLQEESAMNDMQTNSYLSDNFVKKIWPHYEMTLKKVRTRKSYFKYISDICNYLKKDFTAIDESEAQNYFSQLAETKSYEPKYLHLRLSACRSVASYIEKNAQHFNLKNYLSPFVFVDLPEYSDNIHKSDIPSIKQMNTVLSATEDDIMMFTIISICFRCALTVSEICNLKFSDVVEDDLGRLCFIVKGSKSPRVVKIPDDVKEILFRYVDQYPGEDFLFRNSKNQKLLTRTLQYRLRSIMDRADLSKTFTFQDIRNAAIIYMRQGGVTNADLVKYAGLSSEKWVSRFDGVIDGLDLAPCDYSHISIKY